jgi:GNAT superfamily N-acetyltransferase
MSSAPQSVVRVGRLSDFRGLGALYNARGESDRQVFHPFPEGRFVAPLVIFLLLAAQRFFGLLARVRPTWGFAFVVYPGKDSGTIDGFVYLRVRRKTSKGYVANIGTQVGPQARGKGVGPQLISALIVEARTRGVWRIETDFYEQNTASRRMGEKLGFRIPDDPAEARRPGPHGIMVTHILDLDGPLPPPPPPASVPPPPRPPTVEVPGAVASGTAPEGSSQKRDVRQEAVTWAALITAFALIALARLLVLFSQPYPSSGDVAEQLYWSHIWLGTAFPSPVTVWWIPPVYIFLIYIPFTHLFPLFTGQRLLMGIVPALLVFPTYLLLRESNVRRSFSLFGASLLALAAPFSLMLTWNAGYNLFGMFWAILFFAGLTGVFRTHRRGYILLTAVAFGLTAGAHDFTFLFVCAGFALAAVLALLLLPRRKRTIRDLAFVLGVGLLCAAPFALVYFTLAGQTGNVGGAVTLSALNTLALQFLPFTWGARTTWSLLLYVDSAISLVAVAVLVVVRRRSPETPVLLGVLLTGIALSIAYPQVADRGLYFLPLGFYPIVAILFQIVYDRIPPRPTPAGGARSSMAAPDAPVAASVPPRRRTRRGRPRGARAKPVLAVIIVGAFLLLNAQQSIDAQNSGAKFYVGITAEDIPALDWLSHFTAPNAAVFSSESILEKWIWGYSNRQAYAPTPLNLQATTLSYQKTYLSDLATLGQYVVGNSYLAVAQNAPASVGEPLLYLHTAYYWELMLSTAADNVNFTVTLAGHPEELSLSTAQSVANVSVTPCSGCAEEGLLYSWPNLNLSILQRTNLSGETVGLDWAAVGGQLDSVNLTTVMAPASFGVNYVNVTNTSRTVSSVTDQFSLSGDSFSLNASAFNGTVEQKRLNDSWEQLDLVGDHALEFAFQGLNAASPSTPVSTDSGTIFSGLGVSYILTNRADSVPGFGYLMYLRCSTPGEIPGFLVTLVFQSGSIYIFELAPSG